MKKSLILSVFLLFTSGCVMSNEAVEPIPTSEIRSTAEICIPSASVEPDFSALSKKAKGWGFVRKKGGAPEVPSAQQSELSKWGGYYLGNTENKEIYLTFDEGYENGYTAKILDVLREKNVPAAFFVTGPYLEGQRELVQRMIDEGHIIGNHTVHHPNLGDADYETIKSELEVLNEKCEEIYGVTMKYMRPPEGAYSEYSLSVTQALGYKTILWSHAYKDWDVNLQLGTENAINQVVPYFHNGEILLLHAVSKDNAEALSEIIERGLAEGYTFKALDELE